MRKAGSSIELILLFSVSIITQSFIYILYICSLIGDRLRLKAILKRFYNLKDVVMIRHTLLLPVVIFQQNSRTSVN